MRQVEVAEQAARAKSIAWLQADEDPNDAVPVLSFENGNEIVQHMVKWCGDEKPSDWFALYAVETNDGHYHLLLMPQLDKIIQKRLDDGNTMNDDDKIAFIPLGIRAEISDFSREILNKLPPVVTIGILDAKHSLFDNFEDIVHWFEFELKQVEVGAVSGALQANGSIIMPKLGAEIVRDFGVK